MIYTLNGKRISIHAPYTHSDGTRYANLENPSVRQAIGVVEVANPMPADFSYDTYQVQEISDAPYIVYTKKSDEQIMALMAKKFEQALDNHLDSVAQEHRYNDRFTFAIRAGYTGPFQAEGIAFATWMDTCNATGYQLLMDVQAGTKPMPASPQKFIDSLPKFVWPISVIEEPTP